MKKERSFCRFDKDFRIAGRQEIKKYVSLYTEITKKV